MVIGILKGVKKSAMWRGRMDKRRIYIDKINDKEYDSKEAIDNIVHIKIYKK